MKWFSIDHVVGGTQVSLKCWVLWHDGHLFDLEAPVTLVFVNLPFVPGCWCSHRKSISGCPAVCVVSRVWPDFLFAQSQDTAQVSDSLSLSAKLFAQYLVKICKLNCKCSAAWDSSLVKHAQMALCLLKPDQWCRICQNAATGHFVHMLL